jgi:hypothetical protein
MEEPACTVAVEPEAVASMTMLNVRDQSEAVVYAARGAQGVPQQQPQFGLQDGRLGSGLHALLEPALSARVDAPAERPATARPGAGPGHRGAAGGPEGIADLRGGVFGSACPPAR